MNISSILSQLSYRSLPVLRWKTGSGNMTYPYLNFPQSTSLNTLKNRAAIGEICKRKVWGAIPNTKH